MNKKRNFDYALGKYSDIGNRGDVISIIGKKETKTVINMVPSIGNDKRLRRDILSYSPL